MLLGASGAVIVAIVAVGAAWWEAVDYRATSGNGSSVVWAGALAVICGGLGLWVLGLLVTGSRARSVAVLCVSLVGVAVLGCALVLVYTDRYPSEGALPADAALSG